MKWFRAKIRAIVGVALVAFVLQLVLTLGHTHAGEIHRHSDTSHHGASHHHHHHDEDNGGLHDSLHSHAADDSNLLPTVSDTDAVDHAAPNPATDHHHSDAFCAACFILAQATTSFIATSAVLAPPVRITTAIDGSRTGPDAPASVFAAFRSRAPPVS